MELIKDRPAFVRFEVRAEEDRAKTMETGSYVARNVDYALVTPAGSKDVIEREVTSWFRAKEQEVSEGRFPEEWLETYRRRYEAWKRNEEIPENGTSLKNWPLLSPAQLATLLAINLRTVEDVAGANEEAIRRLGMGGRALVEKAKSFLDAKAHSAPSEKVAELTSLVENLLVRNESLTAQLQGLIKRAEAAGVTLEAEAPADTPKTPAAPSAVV